MTYQLYLETNQQNILNFILRLFSFENEKMDYSFVSLSESNFQLDSFYQIKLGFHKKFKLLWIPD